MFDRELAKEQANKITATGKAVGFPANLKVYTGGKGPGVDKWIVYARAFDAVEEGSTWEYLENEFQVGAFINEVSD